MRQTGEPAQEGQLSVGRVHTVTQTELALTSVVLCGSEETQLSVK